MAQLGSRGHPGGPGIKMLLAALAVIVVPLISAAAGAESLRTEHTYQLDDGEARPTATIDHVAWLSGSWTGTAFGAQFEEVWNPPSAGSMVGMYKLMRDDKVDFYELLVIVEEEGSLALKVKHFSDAFVAWEDKPDYVTFRLVKLEEDAVHFSGLSFYRVDEDRIDGYIVMRTNSGIKEEPMHYERVGAATP